MGCGNSKDTVNTNAHGKGKVGSDKNGNIKNSQVRGKALYHTKAASSIHLKHNYAGSSEMIYKHAL